MVELDTFMSEDRLKLAPVSDELVHLVRKVMSLKYKPKRKPAKKKRPKKKGAQLPHGARAIMSARQEGVGSLDFFPTPPWATRALVEVVLPRLGVDLSPCAIWEPACGEGHMAEVLREYSPFVSASDIHDYGYAGMAAQLDFLGDLRPRYAIDWIITNPPFGALTIPFVKRALSLAGQGVAMFVRSQWSVEGVGRYQDLLRDNPPTLSAYFMERVPLHKGRWDPNGVTATAYCWLLWVKGRERLPSFYIPPGQRKALTHDTDRERFTAHPVKGRA